MTLSATYSPGDPLDWATDSSVTDVSLQPRELPEVDDLGWLLSEATHWRDGLPQMVNTLARAGAAETGVLEAEIDVLRVHLDPARYQLLAGCPDVDAVLLLTACCWRPRKAPLPATGYQPTITSSGFRGSVRHRQADGLDPMTAGLAR